MRFASGLGGRAFAGGKPAARRRQRLCRPTPQESQKWDDRLDFRPRLRLAPVGRREICPSPGDLTMSTRFTDDLCAIERPFQWQGVEINTRMVVVRLPGNRLWLH